MKISDYIAQYESKHDEGARIAARLVDIGQDRQQRRSCPAGLIRAGRNAPNAALSTSTLRPFAVTVFAPCAHGNPRGGSSIVL